MSYELRWGDWPKTPEALKSGDPLWHGSNYSITHNPRRRTPCHSATGNWRIVNDKVPSYYLVEVQKAFWVAWDEDDPVQPNEALGLHVAREDIFASREPAAQEGPSHMHVVATGATRSVERGLQIEVLTRKSQPAERPGRHCKLWAEKPKEER